MGLDNSGTATNSRLSGRTSQSDNTRAISRVQCYRDLAWTFVKGNNAPFVPSYSRNPAKGASFKCGHPIGAGQEATALGRLHSLEAIFTVEVHLAQDKPV